MYSPHLKRSLYVPLCLSASIFFTVFLSGCNDSPSALNVACKEVVTDPSECDAGKAVLTLLTKYKSIAESFLLSHQPYIDTVARLKSSSNYNKKLAKFEVLDADRIRSLHLHRKELLDLNATLNDGWFSIRIDLNESIKLRMVESGLLVKIRERSSNIDKLQALRSICETNIMNCRVSVSGVLDIVTEEDGVLLADDFSFELNERSFVEHSVRDYLNNRLRGKSIDHLPKNSLSLEFSDFFQKAVENALLEVDPEKVSLLSSTR